MKLNDATIFNMTLDDKPICRLKEFINSILHRHDLVADVYLNDKLAFTANAHMIVDNNYMFAAISDEFALNERTDINHISVQIRQANKERVKDSILIESFTEHNITIEPVDCNASLYFKVCNVTPFCTTKCTVPESKLTSVKCHNQTKIVLSDRPDNPVKETPISLSGITISDP